MSRDSRDVAPGTLRTPARPATSPTRSWSAAPDGGYAAYGTQPDGGTTIASSKCCSPTDLVSWRPAGYALAAPRSRAWAISTGRRRSAGATARWWMYYSVGHGIDGHHLRVARSSELTGPFMDVGVNLTPGESFAIDPHPFQDEDGQWYLYYARDVLDAERPGTHLAVGRLDDPTTLTDVRAALAPNADWQIYERDRHMYGSGAGLAHPRRPLGRAPRTAATG